MIIENYGHTFYEYDEGDFQQLRTLITFFSLFLNVLNFYFHN